MKCVIARPDPFLLKTKRNNNSRKHELSDWFITRVNHTSGRANGPTDRRAITRVPVEKYHFVLNLPDFGRKLPTEAAFHSFVLDLLCTKRAFLHGVCPFTKLHLRTFHKHDLKHSHNRSFFIFL